MCAFAMTGGAVCGLLYGHIGHHRSLAGVVRTRQHDRDRGMMRRSALATMKLDDGCTDCGFNEDPAALEWDHVRGKSWNIGSRRWCSIERLLEEVEKCEVVCANCHRIRTELRRAA